MTSHYWLVALGGAIIALLGLGVGRSEVGFFDEVATRRVCSARPTVSDWLRDKSPVDCEAVHARNKECAAAEQ